MKSEKIRRMCWAAVLLILPLFAHPLAWELLWKNHVVFLDALAPVGSGVIAAFALAAAAVHPERLIFAYRHNALLRALMIAGGVLLFVLGCTQLIYGGPAEYFWRGACPVFVFFAGIALSKELKHLLPWWCAGLFFLLAAATVRTRYCIGFVGNWNWNFTLLALTLAALVCVVFRSRFRLLAALFCVSCGVAGVFAAFPELAPRGTMAGVIGAAALSGVTMLFSAKERWRYALLVTMAGCTLFISAINTMESTKMPNSRIQLWRGSLDFALTHSIIGVGPARFESRIPPYLPPDYHISDYPATRHPHPHNELLFFWGSFGLAGVAFFILTIVSSVRNVRRKDHIGLWLLWSYLLLLIHGQFDVLLATPLAGTLFWLISGTLAGGGLSIPIDEIPCRKLRLAAAAFLLITGCAAFWVRWQSGTELRRGRMLLSSGQSQLALESLKRSIAHHPTPEALYIAGNIAFFDLHRPEEALHYYREIKEKLHLPSFLHLNRMMGHTLDVLKRPREAVICFQLESLDFPFSALNAGLWLGTLQKTPELKAGIPAVSERFNALMRLRGLKPEDFPKLLRNPDSDDLRRRSANE